MKQPQIGQWCRVRFTDVGARDGICIGHGERKSFLFFEPFEQTRGDWIESNQLIALGSLVTAEQSGLK